MDIFTKLALVVWVAGAPLLTPLFGQANAADSAEAAKLVAQAETGHCSEAIKRLEELSRALPGDGNVAAELGHCQRRAGDAAAARASAEKAAQSNAAAWRVATDKGLAAFDEKRWTDALKLADEALALQAGYFPAKELKGRVLVKQRNFPPGIELLDEVFERTATRESCIDLAFALNSVSPEQGREMGARCPPAK
jgi:tetratricopeptide (TPR) repeat protein